MDSRSVTARDLFVIGLRDAHAMEQEASQIISRQLDRLTNYPEVAERLKLHLEETRRQQNRIEDLLSGLAEAHSWVKDAAAGVMGNMAALAHVPAGDEVLKNSYANFAFENYEIACYTSLVTVGEAAGQGFALTALRETLGEEQRMAQWIADHLAPLSLDYIERRAMGVKADR